MTKTFFPIFLALLVSSSFVNWAKAGPSQRTHRSELCAGDRITNGAWTGTVVEVFASGEASVTWDFYQNPALTVMVDTKRLQKGRRCVAGICRGSRVSASGWTGTVREVFEGGDAFVHWDFYADQNMTAGARIESLGAKYDCRIRACRYVD